MTGYGKAQGAYGNKKITVEVKSLNSKQLDLNVKMPSVYKEHEIGLRSRLAQLMHRGKAELSVSVESEDEGSGFAINQPLALNYHASLKNLAEAIGADEPDYLGTLMRMPEVISTTRQQPDEAEWQTVERIIGEAVEALSAFRTREGALTGNDLEQRINQILQHLEAVGPFEEERIKTVRERLRKNLEDWIGEDKLDQNRLEQELIYYLEKFDISEEKMRLRTHCDYFLETLRQLDSQGKKLGFISQEIGREINTLGSKANHSSIQKLVVQMKDELEKIKEQILNVL
ncbi:MAG: YicC/YloC family endoribonuclease [Bacteroidota bacterium]